MSEAAKINLDEDVLAKRCRRGDPDAMERLMLKYQGRIYNTILKICGNSDDAAELTQDTFVKIIENIDRFEGRSSFYTWAFKIGVNLTLNHCQRHARFSPRSLDAQQDDREDGPRQLLKQFLMDENSPDPAMLAQNREIQEMAVRSLLKLDEAQRTVVVLRDLEGMNYSQIAEVLNIELGTVRSRLSRARSNLREILEALLQ